MWVVQVKSKHCHLVKFEIFHSVSKNSRVMGLCDLCARRACKKFWDTPTLLRPHPFCCPGGQQLNCRLHHSLESGFTTCLELDQYYHQPLSYVNHCISMAKHISSTAFYIATLTIWGVATPETPLYICPWGLQPRYASYIKIWLLDALWWAEHVTSIAMRFLCCYWAVLFSEMTFPSWIKIARSITSRVST